MDPRSPVPPRTTISASPDASATHTHDYGDRELNTLIKQLRADVRGTRAAQTLGKVEDRLRYMQRVVSLHDAQHAGSSRSLLAEERYEAAAGAAFLVWGYDLRIDLLRQIHAVKPCEDALESEHVALALEFDREVLV